MNEHPIESCPECEDLDRRDFIRVVGGTAAVLATTALPAMAADTKSEAKAETRAAKPAEELIKELHSTFSDEQKKTLVLEWDNPARMRMYNAPLNNQRIGKVYTKAQQELIQRIMHSIVSGDEGYKRISRNGNWDTGGGFEGCGCHIFGEPVQGKKFAWLFTGHHLTVRCDGNSLEGAAFGGPMYYGHSPNGYSETNAFNYQTKSTLNVFKALDAKQKEKAIVTGSPGEQLPSVRLRKPGDALPGIRCGELNEEQKVLVETVMRDVLSPYRKEDTDEVMQILKSNGGLDKLHLAFYRDNKMNDNERWHFWRLEAPGFVWNFRVLPHVHCYVNIAATMMG
jgi:hypothetical protein